jgi:hypothetical protein
MATWKKVVVESAADTIAQDTAGNAATVTTNANLTGHVTSTGNAAVLGSFTVSQLSAAISDANLSGNNTGDQATVSGNAGTATALETGRNFSITGEVAASTVSFDGTGAVALSATVADNIIDEPNLKATNAPTDNYILSYDEATTGFTWVAAGSAPNDATITLTAGAGMAALGNFTLNQAGNETFTFAVDGVLEDLDTLGAAASDGQFIVATGAGAFAYEDGTTVRTSLGLGTGDSPQFTDLTLTGDLTVSGTTTTINSTTVEVTDQLIKLANVATPTVITANGSGIQVEASATEAEWPEVKWNNGGALSGWTVANYTATANADLPVSVMSHAAGAPSASVAGVGSFYYDTTNNALYLQTGA